LNIAALGIGSDNGFPVQLETYQGGREGTVAPGMTMPDEPLTLTIHHTVEACLPAWCDFESHALGTLYQNSVWCRAWTETVGVTLAVQPRIVIARSAASDIQFILPLQIRRRQGVRVLEWLGAPHHNYGYGLFAPDFMASASHWFEANWDFLLAQVGGYDAIALTEMPDRLFDHDHPLRSAANMRAPNLSFSMDLNSDFDAIYARKRSSERRRAGRKHESALAQSGPVGFGLTHTAAELHTLIDTMFRHQEIRLAELGIHGVFGTPERSFIHRLADLQDADAPILAPYHLTSNGEVQAVMLGGLHGNCYWALISSIAPGPMRKYSPGEMALRRTIEACCQRGLTAFDFSAGDSAYKRIWADDVITMSMILRGRNLHGVLWAGAMALRLWAKRQIKSTEHLHRLSQALRRILFGTRS
jgi:CelD/BcsL family acetyltransferase involved in cellulose biosynthesis